MDPDSEITTRILLTEPSHIMERLIETEDDHLVDSQINFQNEVMEIDRILETTVTKKDLAEKMEKFRVRHQDMDETFQKEIHFANLSLLNPGTHH